MQPRYDCDCDAVIGMDEMGVGPEEILQYASAILSRGSIRHLIRGLEAILSEAPPDGRADADSSESAALSEATVG